MTKGQPKSLKVPDEKLRRVLTRNVAARVDRAFGNAPNKVTAMAKASGVGRSTIQRILDPDTYGSIGPSIDTVSHIAEALDCEPHELLQDRGC